MNIVQPIKDPKLVRDIINYFKNDNQRNYILFLFGIYTGRRIGDILKLKVEDVKGRDHILIKERKTKKNMRMEINPELKRALDEYCMNKQDNSYLIRSRKGKNQPIRRETAYMILKVAAERFDLDRIGCHTMRKTFGYSLYNQSKKNIGLVMKALNHSNELETLRYIGIDYETINNAITSLKF